MKNQNNSISITNEVDMLALETLASVFKLKEGKDYKLKQGKNNISKKCCWKIIRQARQRFEQQNQTEVEQ